MDTLDAIPFTHSKRRVCGFACIALCFGAVYRLFVNLILITLRQLSTHMCLLLVILIVCQICLIQREFFYIVQILKGYGKKVFLLDSRLPITLPILNRIIKALRPFASHLWFSISDMSIQSDVLIGVFCFSADWGNINDNIIK